MLNNIIGSHIAEINKRLAKAAEITKAADACAIAGNGCLDGHRSIAIRSNNTPGYRQPHEAHQTRKMTA